MPAIASALVSLEDKVNGEDVENNGCGKTHVHRQDRSKVYDVSEDELDDIDDEEPFHSKYEAIKTDRKMDSTYQLLEILGKGKFGMVYKCMEKTTSRHFAAKFIEIKRPQERQEVVNEIELMKDLRHPRLLQLYDAFDDGSKMSIIMELATGGELFSRVIDDEFVLTEKICTVFMRQICEGVQFMHSKNVVHLDMKPENILCVTHTGNRIKLIDFGLARKYSPGDNIRVMFGTPEFVAPEVINYDPVTFATDMWSVGVICYILLSGLSPFMGDNDGETLSNVTHAAWDFEDECFDAISEEAKDFITQLLVKSPEKRLTATQCLRHKWLYHHNQRLSADDPELSKVKLRRFVIRRRWQKIFNTIRALRRMGSHRCESTEPLDGNDSPNTDGAQDSSSVPNSPPSPPETSESHAHSEMSFTDNDHSHPLTDDDLEDELFYPTILAEPDGATATDSVFNPDEPGSQVTVFDVSKEGSPCLTKEYQLQLVPKVLKELLSEEKDTCQTQNCEVTL